MRRRIGITGAWLAVWLITTQAVGAQSETLTPKPPPPEVLPPQAPVGDLLAGLAHGGEAATGFSDTQTDLIPGQPLKLRYPLAAPATEVAAYGWRYSERRQAWRLHTGMDLITEEGQPVLAMLPGRVVLVREIDGYGLTVLMDHGRGWQSLYAHLRAANVAVGVALRPGDPLGQVGQSGSASTPHLHVELRRQTPEGTMALDPTLLLQQAASQR